MDAMSGPRTVAWFSAGAPSAVMAKLLVAAKTPNLVIAYCDTGSEHEDAARFITEAEAWFGHPVERLRSDKYTDIWDVFTKRRFLNSPAGALCTVELKKKVRFAFQQPDDLQAFGYSFEEQARADRFRQLNPEVELLTPLIERGLSKSDCLAIIDRAGIEVPAMYRLGYSNANCVGCVKGGIGYWNKIRVDFPAVFARMAATERDIGASCLRETVGGKSVPLFLDELDPKRGRMSDEPSMDCSLLCATVEQDLAAGGTPTFEWETTQ